MAIMLTGSDVAKSFVKESIYTFSDLEKGALRPFFTNPDRRVFFIHTLPVALTDVLIAMYSRLKNPRGLRGVFVDQFLPELLATELLETQSSFGGESPKFIAARKVKSLEAFVSYSDEARKAFMEFQESISVDPDYITRIASAPKVKKFLRTYLDGYGHNSIARVATTWPCFEQISILAAKSIEWGRPGAGYIELSTRYVDMSTKGLYPIEEELAAYGVDRAWTKGVVEKGFELYQHFEGGEMKGPFPEFLRERHAAFYSNAPGDLASGVFGETCDVLGNFLPACALTSVGCAISGEALPGLVQHLRLDRTPENLALTDAVIAEAGKIGADQFLRHTEISPWKEAAWEYLSIGGELWKNAKGKSGEAFNFKGNLPPRAYVEESLFESFKAQEGFQDYRTWKEVLEKLAEIPRNDHDKLPNHFEGIAGKFRGVMSFRGWRDLQRMSFCAHYRTLVSPQLGFYEYDKPQPSEFKAACNELHSLNLGLYGEMVKNGVPGEMRQYPLALGNLVGFEIVGNLAQFEFCAWQRSKWSVNHEVRRVFLRMETRLREAYPWWQTLSEMAKNAEGEAAPRADITPAYLFARGKNPVQLSISIK